MASKLSALLREIGSLAALAISVCLAIALYTYSPQDPGYNHVDSQADIVNSIDWVGAWSADFLHFAFGRMAWCVVVLTAYLGWRLHRGRGLQVQRQWGWLAPVLGIIVGLPGACALENLYFPVDAQSVFHAADIPAGGIVGKELAALVTQHLGAIGGSVVFIALCIAGFTFVTQLSWFEWMDRVGYSAFAAGGWLRGRIASRVDRKVGATSRRKRRASVDELRADLDGRKPPKIAPRIDAEIDAEDDTRPKKQRQRTLLPKAEETPLPPLSLLEKPGKSRAGYSNDELESMSKLLVKKLKDFHVDVVVEAVQPGPVITRFEVEPAPGIKASQIVGLARDLARSLSVESVRVVDNIAGKTVIGIEVPNQSREVVRLVEGLASPQYESSASPLSLVLGKDIAGNPVLTDLARMPHVLIAGTTGSGKSVCVNALILSLVYKSSPEKVRMIMVDPKFLELSAYDGIPHLLAPVVTDMSKAANALRWCIGEMDRRFRVMAAIKVRHIAGYNKKVEAAIDAGKPLEDPLAPPPPMAPLTAGEDDAEDAIDAADEWEAPTLQPIPYIVVVVDELADLMMVVGKKIEEIIIRIAQRARAAGIHLVLATQRPSVDVVTGLIKANVPTRIAFQVSSRADSRTVLDQMGAEQLLGQGDMLFLPPGTGFTMRVHGSFVSDEEVTRVVKHLKQGAPPVYLSEITEGGDGGDIGGGGRGRGASFDADEQGDVLYEQAVAFVTKSRRASISSVQRALRVGYNRAARLIETMEENGVVSASDNGKREVLVAATEG